MANTCVPRQAVFVGFFGSDAERAFLRLGLGWAILAVAQHIGHALRSPQSFDRVLLRRKVRRIIDTHVSHFRALSWLPSERGASTIHITQPQQR